MPADQRSAYAYPVTARSHEAGLFTADFGRAAAVRYCCEWKERKLFDFAESVLIEAPHYACGKYSATSTAGGWPRTLGMKAWRILTRWRRRRSVPGCASGKRSVAYPVKPSAR